MADRIDVREISGKADRDAFIRLPGQVNAGDPHWVEPLHMERREFMDPKHNAVFGHMDIVFFLAWRDGRPVGRISAQIDRNAPDFEGRKLGFFGMISFIEDEAVVAALFETAEAWLRERGVEEIRGPFSLSGGQEVGLLVEGFDTDPSLLMPHDPRWAGPMIEGRGYEKGRDLMCYRLATTYWLPDTARHFATSESEIFDVRPLDMSRFEEEIRNVGSVYNDAWSENWGFVPLTDDEVAQIGRDLKLIIDPELFRIAEVEGEMVGFIVLLPNVNEAIKDLGGRLFPFGILKLLWRLKMNRIRTARVPLMGIRKSIQVTPLGKLLPFRLIYALENRYMQRKFRELELSWILEDNRPVRRVIEHMGGRCVRVNRVYRKVVQ